MMHTVRKTSGKKSAMAFVRCNSVLVFLFLVLLGCPIGTYAEDEQPAPLFNSLTQTTKDIEIVARIRQALRQDAQLRSLNLSVRMSGGVASLSGPVPTLKLKKRALSIVERVEGVLTVSAKDLYISTSDRGNKTLAVVIQEDRPTQTRSASPSSLSSSLGSFDSRLSMKDSQPISPRAPEKAAPAARASQAARLTAHPHPVSSSVSISIAVEQLRRRDARYQQIRARVEDTTVFVFPGDTSSEDAMTFAQAVRRLPGVQHVILSSDSR
jgi:osmotically-inducible protein OsmY